jgi:hypothetical protein
MGGIGISMNSQDGEKSPSTPLTMLPSQVVEEIANKLGISINAKDALAKGKIDLPENIDIKITRLSKNTSCTIKKQGAEYTVTYEGKSVTVRA